MRQSKRRVCDITPYYAVAKAIQLHSDPTSVNIALHKLLTNPKCHYDAADQTAAAEIVRTAVSDAKAMPEKFRTNQDFRLTQEFVTIANDKKGKRLLTDHVMVLQMAAVIATTLETRVGATRLRDLADPLSLTVVHDHHIGSIGSNSAWLANWKTVLGDDQLGFVEGILRNSDKRVDSAVVQKLQKFIELVVGLVSNFTVTSDCAIALPLLVILNLATLIESWTAFVKPTATSRVQTTTAKTIELPMLIGGAAKDGFDVLKDIFDARQKKKLLEVRKTLAVDYSKIVNFDPYSVTVGYTKRVGVEIFDKIAFPLLEAQLEQTSECAKFNKFFSAYSEYAANVVKIAGVDTDVDLASHRTERLWFAHEQLKNVTSTAPTQTRSVKQVFDYESVSASVSHFRETYAAQIAELENIISTYYSGDPIQTTLAGHAIVSGFIGGREVGVRMSKKVIRHEPLMVLSCEPNRGEVINVECVDASPIVLQSVERSFLTTHVSAFAVSGESSAKSAAASKGLKVQISDATQHGFVYRGDIKPLREVFKAFSWSMEVDGDVAASHTVVSFYKALYTILPPGRASGGAVFSFGGTARRENGTMMYETNTIDAANADILSLLFAFPAHVIQGADNSMLESLYQNRLKLFVAPPTGAEAQMLFDRDNPNKLIEVYSQALYFLSMTAPEDVRAKAVAQQFVTALPAGVTSEAIYEAALPMYAMLNRSYTVEIPLLSRLFDRAVVDAVRADGFFNGPRISGGDYAFSVTKAPETHRAYKALIARRAVDGTKQDNSNDFCKAQISFEVEKIDQEQFSALLINARNQLAEASQDPSTDGKNEE